MVQRAIIIAGLVRAPESFLGFLGDLLPFAEEHNIRVIISTWKGEIAKYPEIYSLIIQSNITLIEQEEPDLILPGHVLHQVQSIDAALSILTDETFALRLRPDFASMTAVRMFFSQERVPVKAANPKIRHPFRHRFYISQYFLAHPFYINDICFSGIVRDIKELMRIPLIYVTKCTRMAPEQIIWGTPTICMNPIFDHYFRSNVGLVFDNREMSLKTIACMSASKIYARALAAYAHFLNDVCFSFEQGIEREEVARQCELLTLEEILWSDTKKPWLQFSSSTQTVTSNQVDVANALVLNRFRNSPFGERFRFALRELEQENTEFSDPQAKVNGLIAESTELADALETDTNVLGFKAIRHAGLRYWISGVRPLWRITGERTQREEELENEINRLRRLIETLRDQPRT